MSEQAKRELIDQLERSGIPAAVRSQRAMAVIAREFDNDATRMAEEIARLRQDATRIDWLSRHIVEVRENLLYGSREIFLGVPGGNEETTMDEPWDIRAQIDKAMKPKRNRRLSERSE